MEQTLGKRIVANRKRLNMTQEQLAEQLGVTAQAVSKWENDQSCPDIGILPKLANIFGISTDALLGNVSEGKVHQAEVVDNEDGDGVQIRTGGGKYNWEFQWDSGRKSALCFAVWVLGVGVLYLLSQLLSWDLSFWDVLWPTTVLIFGINRLLEKWSFFGLACTLFGGYTLADKIFDFSFDVGSKTVWAVLIILFGLSLLADAFRKTKKPKITIKHPNINPKIKINGHAKDSQNAYTCDSDSFSYAASFGDCDQLVAMPILREGDIGVSFGDYTVDLTGVENVTADCQINAACSFGELEIIVPKRFRVVTENATFFASLDIDGKPDENPVGQIQLSGGVSFGEITVTYV